MRFSFSVPSDRWWRELYHRIAIRSQPESGLSRDPRLREQPGGENRGDLLCESQLFMSISWENVGQSGFQLQMLYVLKLTEFSCYFILSGENFVLHFQ